jgi:flagellar hook assembly protein FlgD
VKLNIFDIAGKRVASLADEIQDAGNKAYMWQARSEKGDSLPSGIYFCILKAGPRVESIKMLYLK